MRSGIRSRPKHLDSRLMRTGLALLLTAAIPAQALAMVGTGVRPGPIKAGPGKPAAVSVSLDSAATVKAKIQPSVLDAFQHSDKARYLVKLKLQADVAGAAASARQRAATPAAAELAARSAVIHSLQEAADLSQAGLVAFLEKAQSMGQVESFEPFWITNMVAVTSDKATLEKIAARPEVEAIYEDEKVHLIKSDIVTIEESVETLSGAPEWNIERIGAPAVWRQFEIDGTGVVVASMDTGVDPDHPALAEQYRGVGAADHSAFWFDAVNGRPEPYDDEGHGTHTAGTMVGRTPDGENQIGVAPGAKWIAAKMLDEFGSGYTSWILQAGQWIMAPGGDPANAPDVVNNSWGGSSGMNEWFRDVVVAWRAAGIVPVFANGNSGPGAGTVGVPANYPESIGVGNVTKDDTLNSGSSRGPSPYGEIKPEVSAPGTAVRSALPGGMYGAGTGTSMAAPHVAGTAALLRQVDASLTVDEIEAILTSTADPMTDAQYATVPNNGYGHGIVNAYKAVAQALGLAEGRISGRLLAEGDDLIGPTIRHTPVTQGFKGTPTTIEAEITDDVSLSAVYLRFRQPGLNWWGIVDMTQTSGDHTGGTFVGTIPAELSTTDTMEYYIEAVDFGNNRAFSGTRNNPHVITMLDGVKPGYLEDFEGSIVGWSTGGEPADLWQIGEPTSGPGAAYSGQRVAATNLDGEYTSNAQAFLITPPIDLRDGAAALRFRHWYNMETNFDLGIVAITADYGETWEILATYTGTNGAYQEAVIDLSAYAGLSNLFLAFVLDTDVSVVREGWYIDDVEIYVDNEPPAVPTNLSAQATPLGSIALTWDATDAGDFDHYTVYRSTTSGEGYAPIATTTDPAYSDFDVESGTTYYYVVTVSDFFGNESEYSAEASATAAHVVIRFRDDMESGPGEWTTAGTNNSWEWGVPTSGPGEAFSGENLWATNLAGNYPNNADASLISPPIDLSGLSSAALAFTHWYRLERNWDYGRVEVTADGGETWTELAIYTSPASGGAPVGPETPLIDLTDYVGGTVQVRFRHTSDGSVSYPGWYIDDVIVSGAEAGAGAEAVPAPVSLSKPGDSITPKDEKPAETVILRHQLPRAAKSEYRVETEEPVVRITALPIMEGTVTVLENGRVVRTNPGDGSYSLALPAGTYTLMAESYGYYPQTRQVDLGPNEELTVNFLLQEIPRGLLAGTVTDARTGEPIEGARVQVLDDARVAPTTTDAAGRFSLNLLEGSYTLRVSHRSHYMEEITVDVPGNQTTELSIVMRPFAGIPGELAYDDGTAETAWAMYDAGNGWAVRMSPEPGQTVMVTGARVYLWDTTWPTPGGNTFMVAVYGSRPDGSPGDLLLSPVLVEDAVRGAWNEVDLRPYGITVQGDFYVAVIQAADYPNVPGLAFDETVDQGRTYEVVDGVFGPWTEPSNAMIRALVSTEVGPPAILSPADGTFTNETEVLVEGRSSAGTSVAIYVNDELAAETAAEADGTFSATLTLDEGEYTLTAVATTADGDSTDPSAPVRVTVDLTAPELTIDEPQDGAVQNHRLLTVAGQALDLHLAGVDVNGTAAEVDVDGRFTAEIIVREGENLVTVTAVDRAGNATSASVTMTVDSTAPELTNLQPDADLTLTAGDTLTVSFESEPGLALAAFSIVANLGGGSAAGDDASFGLEPGEIAMTETEPGRYEGTFTVPDDMSMPEALVRFRAMDAAGNTTRATAPGTLTIVLPEDEDPGEPDPGEPDPGEPDPGEPDPGEPDPAEPGGPVAVITGPTEVEVNRNSRWDAHGSASDVPIISYEWDMGDGSRIQRGRTVAHRYKEAGTYTITLTVTDRNGNTATTTLDVVVGGGQHESAGPNAVIDGPSSVQPNQLVKFSGLKSTSSSQILRYEWDMGDGTQTQLPMVVHRWTSPGTYTVTLTVTDLAGNTASVTMTVEVTQ